MGNKCPKLSRCEGRQVERGKDRESTYMSAIHILIGGLGRAWSNSGAECWRAGSLWLTCNVQSSVGEGGVEEEGAGCDWEVFLALCRCNHDNEGSKGSEDSVRRSKVIEESPA